MKIVLDIPEALLNRIKDRIDKAEFTSISSFFYFAAENQLTLQDTDSLIESTHVEPSIVDEVSEPYQRHIKTKVYNRETGEPLRSLRFKNKDWQGAIRLESYENLANKPLESHCLPVSGQDEMMWGQINRIFPVKFATRVLANFQNQNQGNELEFNQFLDQTSEIAAEFASHIEKEDVLEKRSRDERISVGFPSSQRGEREMGKSLSRYKNQFLVYLRRKTGDVSGAMAQLGLVCISGNKNKKLTIGLTSYGVEFAGIENPILDSNQTDEVFSSKERELYFKLLTNHLPKESNAMCLLLNFINIGVTKRIDLNNALKKEWPNDWSEAVINTQRSGLTARLKEFRLIDKEKSGIEVTYKITGEGISFLKNYFNFNENEIGG